jgi:Transposase IS116/IS110/IS902 family
MGRLPEAWIAPPAVRELRELVRHRAKLVHARTSLRCQVHAVLAGQGVQVPVSDLFGVQGSKLLAELQLPVPYRYRIDSLLRLMEAFDREIDQTTSVTTERLRQDPGFLAVQTIPGVGPILGAVFVAEIGDVHRFPEPSRLASWAGFDAEALRVRHHRAPRSDHQAGQPTGPLGCGGGGGQRTEKGSRLAAVRDRVAARRGRNIGTVAAARELVEMVFDASRDHHVRRLTRRLPAGHGGVSSKVSRSVRVVVVMTPNRRGRPH